MSINSIIRLLSFSQDDLLRECRSESFQASGPGGQKRNRVYSAVRLTHLPTGISSESSKSRKAGLNQVSALSKLRLKAALGIIKIFTLEPNSRKDYSGLIKDWPPFRDKINKNHRDFPDCVFSALNSFWIQRSEISKAAAQLGVSSSALTRFFKIDNQVWAQAGIVRKYYGKVPLK